MLWAWSPIYQHKKSLGVYGHPKSVRGITFLVQIAVTAILSRRLVELSQRLTPCLERLEPKHWPRYTNFFFSLLTWFTLPFFSLPVWTWFLWVKIALDLLEGWDASGSQLNLTSWLLLGGEVIANTKVVTLQRHSFCSCLSFGKSSRCNHKFNLSLPFTQNLKLFWFYSFRTSYVLLWIE